MFLLIYQRGQSLWCEDGGFQSGECCDLVPKEAICSRSGVLFSVYVHSLT